MKLKIFLGAFAAIAIGGITLAQQGYFGPNLPIVGGAAYSCGSVNGVSNCTVPAGPLVLTGNETIPVNTNLSQGRSPQQVLVKPANLNANPITFQTVVIPTATAATPISASNLDGGVVYISTGTITSANITLPSSAINGQTYHVSSNRTITTLSVTAASGDSMGTNTTPTVLTASTTVPNGYNFICSKSGTVCTWYRLQ
jgi:hypothetical protein